jgi:hypothetical protein
MQKMAEKHSQERHTAVLIKYIKLINKRNVLWTETSNFIFTYNK